MNIKHVCGFAVQLCLSVICIKLCENMLKLRVKKADRVVVLFNVMLIATLIA